MSWDLSNLSKWSAFLQDRWYLVAAAIIALIVVIKIVKSVIKWVLVLAIAAAVLAYGFHYGGSLKTIGSQVLEASKEQAVKAMVQEAETAKYRQNDDGTYTLSTNAIELKGELGSDKAKIYLKGQYVGTVDLSGELKAAVDAYRNGGKEG